MLLSAAKDRFERAKGLFAMVHKPEFGAVMIDAYSPYTHPTPSARLRRAQEPAGRLKKEIFKRYLGQPEEAVAT